MLVEPRTALGLTVRKCEEPAPLRAVLGLPPAATISDRDVLESVREAGGMPDEVYLECEVVEPQSTAGRTVWVHIPAVQVLAVLKLCRDAAAAARSRPLEESHARSES